MADMDNAGIVPGFDDEKVENLKITLQKIESVDNGLVIYLDGYIDTYNSTFFQKQINLVMGAGFTRLIFNCAALNYVSSTGIGSFTAFLKILKPKGGDVILLALRPNVREVFQLLGFSQFFAIHNSLDESIAYFKDADAQSCGVFPKIFPCPVCSKKLKAVRAGRFRCSECKSILSIDDAGSVSLG